MTDDITNTEFAGRLRAMKDRLSDESMRRLVFAYCQRYQEEYWFDQLQNAFTYLELEFAGEFDVIRGELPAIRAEVQDAMGEYFVSLNEVATAVDRLLDKTPFAVDDVIRCLGHVINAYDCQWEPNQDADEFIPREDRYLCDLLTRFSP